MTEQYKKLQDDMNRMFIEQGHYSMTTPTGETIKMGGPIPHFYSGGTKVWDEHSIWLFQQRIEYLKKREVMLYQEVNEILYLEKEIANNPT